MSPAANNPAALSVFALTAALAPLLVAPGTLRAAPESPGQPPPRQASSQPTTEQASPEAPAEIPPEAAASKPAPPPARRDEEFKKLVANVRLVGNFTMEGGEDLGKLHQEEYAITGAIKLGNGDYWALTSRITYGDVDLTVPVPVQVKWAGNTPVITVDGVKIPGLGTFSARVLLDGDRYAGTWSHDEKGGHLFGVIERDEAEAK